MTIIGILRKKQPSTGPDKGVRAGARAWLIFCRVLNHGVMLDNFLEACQAPISPRKIYPNRGSVRIQDKISLGNNQDGQRRTKTPLVDTAHLVL